jgi:hypothetical protein
VITAETVANKTGEIDINSLAAIGATVAVTGAITVTTGTVPTTIGKGFRYFYEEWPAVRS